MVFPKIGFESIAVDLTLKKGLSVISTSCIKNVSHGLKPRRYAVPSPEIMGCKDTLLLKLKENRRFVFPRDDYGRFYARECEGNGHFYFRDFNVVSDVKAVSR